MTKERIYFDHAATSIPKARGVGIVMQMMLEGGAYNVGRGCYEEAYQITEQILDTRERIKRLFHASEDSSVCFTRGITESLNIFLKGLLVPGDHVIVSGMEHNAVMRPLHTLQKLGIQLSIAPCDIEGGLIWEELDPLFQENTRAVVCTHASNVCGTILPIEQIGKLCERQSMKYQHKIWFAVDSAQTAGICPIDMQGMKIDFLAFAGHKGLRGPQGIGGFLLKTELARELTPLVEGGTGSFSDSEEQPELLPDKFESGTLPLPAIIGLRQALMVLEEHSIEAIHQKQQQLTSYFLEQLAGLSIGKIAGIANSQRIQERVAVVSVDFTPLDNAMIAFELEQKAGILTRVGLHCAPRAHQSLHTFPQGTVRFSFGEDNTKEEIDRCIQALNAIANEQ